MYRLYEFSPSGNCYKVRLLLKQLQIPFDRVEIDITKGQAGTPEFLKMNPNGRTPVLELKKGQYLSESNAILYYLAEGTPFLPADKLERAQVLQWMFFEQYDHEPNIATSRYWIAILGQSEVHREELGEKKEAGHEALAIMDVHLSLHNYFVGDRYSIADIALYAYTHVAHEGGFDLSGYPAVQAWLNRVATQPRHIKITD